MAVVLFKLFLKPIKSSVSFIYDFRYRFNNNFFSQFLIKEDYMEGLVHRQTSACWPAYELNTNYSQEGFPEDDRHPFLTDYFENIPDDHECVKDLNIRPIVQLKENEITKKQTTVVAIIIVLATLLLKTPSYFFYKAE